MTVENLTLTIGQVADLLQVGTLQVRRLWMRKQFPAPVGIGRLIRWRRSDVESWLMNQPTADTYEKKDQDNEHGCTSREANGTVGQS